MNNRIRIARGTSLKLESCEDVLAAGQPFYNKTDRQLYIGDGETKLKEIRTNAAFSQHKGIAVKNAASVGLISGIVCVPSTLDVSSEQVMPYIDGDYSKGIVINAGPKNDITIDNNAVGTTTIDGKLAVTNETAINSTLTVSSGIVSNSTLSVVGETTLQGNLNLTTLLLPVEDDKVDIGSTAKRIKDIHIKGNIDGAFAVMTNRLSASEFAIVEKLQLNQGITFDKQDNTNFIHTIGEDDTERISHLNIYGTLPTSSKLGNYTIGQLFDQNTGRAVGVQADIDTMRITCYWSNSADSPADINKDEQSNTAAGYTIKLGNVYMTSLFLSTPKNLIGSNRFVSFKFSRLSNNPSSEDILSVTPMYMIKNTVQYANDCIRVVDWHYTDEDINVPNGYRDRIIFWVKAPEALNYQVTIIYRVN